MRAEGFWNWIPLASFTLFLAFFTVLGRGVALHWSARSGFLVWLVLAAAVLRISRLAAAPPDGRGRHA